MSRPRAAVRVRGCACVRGSSGLSRSVVLPYVVTALAVWVAEWPWRSSFIRKALLHQWRGVSLRAAAAAAAARSAVVDGQPRTRQATDGETAAAAALPGHY